MLSLNEINDGMKDLKEWALEMDSISKVFAFQNFKQSLEFVNKVGEIAEKLNHHPDIFLQFDIVKLISTTRCDKGLSKKDFEFAKEVDKLDQITAPTEQSHQS